MLIGQQLEAVCTVPSVFCGAYLRIRDSVFSFRIERKFIMSITVSQIKRPSVTVLEATAEFSAPSGRTEQFVLQKCG